MVWKRRHGKGRTSFLKWKGKKAEMGMTAELKPKAGKLVNYYNNKKGCRGEKSRLCRVKAFGGIDQKGGK